uniref:Protein tumorous imaginal discs, mitochondrial-like n=2 Tax=Hirondellea gigas TaxID=1518452 RepID=A0A2P2HZ61_9CRUS
MATVRSVLRFQSLTNAIYVNKRLLCLCVINNKSSVRNLHTHRKPAFLQHNHYGPLLLQVSQFHRSSSLTKNYYEKLSVAKNASQKEIKKAYYQMAKKYHPDVNKNDPSAEKKFSEASEAYEVLGDEEKRQQYDNLGSYSQQAAAGAEGPFHGASYQYHRTVDPEELFRKIFGDFRANMDQGGDFAESHFGYKASDEITVHLSFKESARGLNKDIHLNVVAVCPKCDGTRCMLGTKAIRCHYCNGTGTETISTGPFVMRQTCRYCGGTRMIIPNPCDECVGKGQTVQRKTVSVQIPAGITDGQTLRMTVTGKEVFVHVKVKDNPYFRRDGSDVHTDASISLSQAVLGGTTRIQGVYEDITVQIPSGSSSHSRLTLSGKGMKRVNSYGQGDHIVHLKVKAPNTLTPQQRALFITLAELETGTPGTVSGITKTTDGKKASIEFNETALLIRAVLDGSIEQMIDPKLRSSAAKVLDVDDDDGNTKRDDAANDDDGKSSASTVAAAASSSTLQHPDDIDKVVGKKIDLKDEELETDTKNPDSKGKRRN